jgi:2-polyprenyl-3-methyl-5-hydroxy-6-metoxy-1,4-benzoquinol methylase
MDCCKHNQSLNGVFNEQMARSEVEGYFRKGIGRPARAIVEAVRVRGVEGASVLEVGAGIGGLHLELLKRGAARATDVDVSAAYVAAAQSVAETLSVRERVDYRVADFAHEGGVVPEADVVVMHRVVCCYPDMPRLVTTAAQHARRLMALSFPTGTWYMRLFEKIMNFSMWLTRSDFRFYVHPPEAILATAASAGLRPVQHKTSWPWQIVVFERGS